MLRSILIREKLNRVRFFIDNLRYRREKHFYFALFFLVVAISIVSVSMFLYQKKQIETKNNIIASYYEELEKGKNDLAEINYDNNFPDNYENPDSKDSKDDNDVVPGEDKNKEIKIKVYICGFVNNPGVYELSGDSRLVDLLKFCGGAAENASLEAVNLAAMLSDGDMVYIPSENEIKEEGISFFNYPAAGIISTGSEVKADSNNKISSTKKIININSASPEELMSLPGIGEKTAAAIMEYREVYGLFTNKEELKNVKGIGEKKYEKIKDLISV